ncbi:channel protein, hemolysin III family [Ferrimonas balearica DSM 9799]|uniref:Channel protein, hemolysin III family n=2 Tax=Ferrimonas balearica TaxID=44012 RepID=E1SSI5_FERBD|nr:channel protein, hemolysin III family [Ferrimonas balearica DSM 9799]MBW3138923.1 hemolysin III family protein [Ferrimonas balearica]MBW3163485.1 hemolysin III family protein [Ferrimonas balearica]MBY5979706.1 hemolysin III family protein [Ferrimonas balearica]MBY6105985.1 hemolysin III family protein [Ferrimonas balearica]
MTAQNKNSNGTTDPMQIRAYSIGEEIANAVTHGLGVAAAIVGLTLMLNKGIPVLPASGIAAISVYGATLILMFLCSTLYHSIQHEPAKAVLKRLDHCAIYLLIAGSYTPLMLIALDNSASHLLLAFIWVLAAMGVLFKALFVHRFKKLAMVTYLAMGWASLAVIVELYAVLPTAGFILLLAGGLSYSLGTLFYAAKRFPYTHAIWHLFVLGGAVCHCLTIALYVIP